MSQCVPSGMPTAWKAINGAIAVTPIAMQGSSEEPIDKIVVPAALIPIIASTGGVAGNQTLTLVTRGFALVLSLLTEAMADTLVALTLQRGCSSRQIGLRGIAPHHSMTVKQRCVSGNRPFHHAEPRLAIRIHRQNGLLQLVIQRFGIGIRGRF